MLRPASLDVAIAGTRGVPACYSGFETFAEELGRRLVERGHRVTVYGRVPYVGRARREHLGMQVVPVRSPRGKHLETPLHTLASALVSLRAGHDVVLLCNGANAFALPLFKLGGARVAINVDGIDRQRRKWGALGKLWFFLGERLALLLSDRAVTDAAFLRDYYCRRYRWLPDTIPYGGDRDLSGLPEPEGVLARYGLERGRYVLLVGRMVPENNALLVVEAFRQVRGDARLIVLGDTPYSLDYKRAVHAAAESQERVILAGGVYGDDYLVLQQHAACYVAAGEVGGTHPALVEAMSFGGAIVANDVPEHREVLGEGALYYRPGDASSLAAAIEQALENGSELVTRSRARSAVCYRWEHVVDRYEELFTAMASEGRLP